MNERTDGPITIGVTTDLVAHDGSLAFPDYPLARLARHGISIRHIDTAPGHDPAGLSNLDILLSVPHGAPIDAAAIEGADRMLAVVRVGVGYEDCDVAALTRAGIALIIPTDATQRPTAVAALTLMLALATRLLDKHRLTLAGARAWPRRADLRGQDLRGKVLGLIGCGAIGRHLIEISRPLGLGYVVHDPALDQAGAERLGAKLLSLDDLLRVSDIVSLHCPLNNETFHLLDEARLRLMKPEAYLVNTARGGIVDQQALARLLGERRIAGAGLDVFEAEPPSEDDPLLRLDNVVLSAHALNWTRELDADLGRSNCEAIEALLAGAVPDGVVNRRVVDDPRFRAKLAQIARRRGAGPVARMSETGVSQ